MGFGKTSGNNIRKSFVLSVRCSQEHMRKGHGKFVNSTRMWLCADTRRHLSLLVVGIGVVVDVSVVVASVF